MKKVIVVGAGIAGMAAVLRLLRAKNRLEIIMIDQKKALHFLPLLPDLIGRGFSPDNLLFDLKAFSKRIGIRFKNEEVTAIDLDKKEVLAKESIQYDYLLIAAGSRTNFYGQKDIENNSYKLDDVNDAEKIVEALESGKYENFIISGGGYTGIEIATNIWRYFKRRGEERRIVIAEATSGILGPLPQWMRTYVRENLEKMGVELYVNNKVEQSREGKVRLSSGREFDKAMLIWSAGVKAGDLVGGQGVEKNAQGRMKVDYCLRIDNSCFSVGDSAQFLHRGRPLRMAIQFSIAQGDLAARNILNIIDNKPLLRYQPRDLGYLIPMANNRACGMVLGVPLRGWLPCLLHYFMCIYRSYSIKNKIGITKGVIRTVL